VHAFTLPQIDLGLAEDIVRAASEEEMLAHALRYGQERLGTSEKEGKSEHTKKKKKKATTQGTEKKLKRQSPRLPKAFNAWKQEG
jgi:hypothetical protein